MELPINGVTSKLLETIAFNTRPKIEEHMLIVMDDSTSWRKFTNSITN